MVGRRGQAEVLGCTEQSRVQTALSQEPSSQASASRSLPSRVHRGAGVRHTAYPWECPEGPQGSAGDQLEELGCPLPYRGTSDSET